MYSKIGLSLSTVAFVILYSCVILKFKNTAEPTVKTHGMELSYRLLFILSSYLPTFGFCQYARTTTLSILHGMICLPNSSLSKIFLAVSDYDLKLST